MFSRNSNDATKKITALDKMGNDFDGERTETEGGNLLWLLGLCV